MPFLNVERTTSSTNHNCEQRRLPSGGVLVLLSVYCVLCLFLINNHSWVTGYLHKSACHFACSRYFAATAARDFVLIPSRPWKVTVCVLQARTHHSPPYHHISQLRYISVSLHNKFRYYSGPVVICAFLLHFLRHSHELMNLDRRFNCLLVSIWAQLRNTRLPISCFLW